MNLSSTYQMWWIFRWCLFKYSFSPFSLCTWTQPYPLNCQADPLFFLLFLCFSHCSSLPFRTGSSRWLHCNPLWHVLPYIHYTFWLLNSSFFCMISTFFFLNQSLLLGDTKVKTESTPPCTHTLLDAEWTEPSGDGLYLCWCPRLPSFVLAEI